MFLFYLISFHYIRSDYVSIDLIRFDLPDFWLGMIYSIAEDGRAISGYAFLINGGAVSWSPK